jgi:glycosidase
MSFTSTILTALLTAAASVSGQTSDTSRVVGTSGVPEWSQHVVWYQIFPERFRNGTPSNDPTEEDQVGAWPHERTKDWRISPWTSDWYQLQPWEKTNGKGFYFNAQKRRYGGDLQGVIDKLDYLKDLGIGALYFTPIFQSPSLHKYDATMYHHVDKNFGPDPDGDRKLWATENPEDPSTWKWTSADKLFLTLIHEAHKRNIKVIIDGVFNHVGTTFWAFEDVLKKQQASRYKDWFTVEKWDDPSTPQDEFKYVGWNGVPDLPQWREDGNGIVHGPREHIHAIVKRWMDPNGDGNPEDGIDGWRLDVAEKIQPAFWKEFRMWVRGINPRAYIVGEVWWEDWPKDKMFNAAPWLQGDMFDAVMNYRWAREAFRFFGSGKDNISASEFLRRLQALLDDYPAASNYVLMNLYDSHDTDRMGSHLMNPDLPYDHRANPNDNPSYDVQKPGPRELMVQKLMALFQMTYVGAPMIYYGTEAGMWGGDDPDCRKPMVWPDYIFDDERSHPFGSERRADHNGFDQDLFGWYSKIIKLRNTHPVLRTGMFEPILTPDTSGILAFRRAAAGEQCVVVLNNTWITKRISIPILYRQDGELTDLLSLKKFIVSDGSVTITIEGKSGVVLQ